MSTAKTTNDGVVLSGVPRVHLLPQEFVEARTAGVVRKRLIVGIIAAAVLVGAGAAAATYQLGVANSALAAEQARTALLGVETAKYGPVTTIQTQVGAITVAQPIASTGEILWGPYMAKVQATLPAGTGITAFTAKLADSAVVGTVPKPMEAPHIAVLSLTADSPQASVSDWLDNLAKLPGFVSATPGNVVRVAETGRYTVNVDLLLDKDVLSLQFDKKVTK
jgi:hypothetical protein